MIFYEVDKNNFIAKISNSTLKSIDIFDVKEVEEFIKIIFKQILDKHKISGEVELNIYIDNNYGIIIEITCDDVCLFDEDIDVRVIFHLNNIFLYEVDYFNLIESTNIKNNNIYYYNNKFYLEIINDIAEKDFYQLLEASNIIWDDKCFEIVEKGIKLTI